jgi:hypothetical protein
MVRRCRHSNSSEAPALSESGFVQTFRQIEKMGKDVSGESFKFEATGDAKRQPAHEKPHDYETQFRKNI